MFSGFYHETQILSWPQPWSSFEDAKLADLAPKLPGLYGTISSFFADRTTDEVIQRILELENPEAEALVWPTNGEETAEAPVQGPPLKINPKKPARKFTGKKTFLETAEAPVQGPPLKINPKKPARKFTGKKTFLETAEAPVQGPPLKINPKKPSRKFTGKKMFLGKWKAEAGEAKEVAEISHVRKLVGGEKPRDIER